MDINQPYETGARGRTQIQYTAVLSVKFSDEDETEPVTLTEAKDWCAVDGTDRDAKMNMLIEAARRKVERVRQISLINRTVTAKVKPGTNLPYGPVKEIVSVTDDNENTYEDYNTVTNDVTVVYSAGFGDDLPEDYKVMILQQIAFMLENAGDGVDGKGGISPMVKR